MTRAPSESDLPASPLLRLPLEIRLMIYEYMLLPSSHPTTTYGTSVANLLPDFHTYFSDDTNNDPFTLSVRTIDPWLGAQASRTWRRRSTYYVRTGTFPHYRAQFANVYSSNIKGPFLTTTTPTTYRILLSPYTAHLRYTVPSLLGVNRQIHAEASKILYSTYTFSFHTSIEAAVPFLSDLTPTSRSHVKRLSITKKALPYTKEFDRAEWEGLCAYLSTSQIPIQSTSSNETPQILPQPSMFLQHLHLNIIAGRPDNGWTHIDAPTAQDYATMLRMKQQWGGGSVGGMDLEWAEQLMRVRGLRSMSVKALVEHCARPVSEKLAFWVAFSKSVEEGGFGDWVRGVMVQ
ncbi:autophagy-related protein 3 [Stagonosporopsis vannaccii]|nr:autophagy-related protein 3 [Stagonosporopsis vannaccii]